VSYVTVLYRIAFWSCISFSPCRFLPDLSHQCRSVCTQSPPFFPCHRTSCVSSSAFSQLSAAFYRKHVPPLSVFLAVLRSFFCCPVPLSSLFAVRRADRFWRSVPPKQPVVQSFFSFFDLARYHFYSQDSLGRLRFTVEHPACQSSDTPPALRFIISPFSLSCLSRSPLSTSFFFFS